MSQPIWWYHLLTILQMHWMVSEKFPWQDLHLQPHEPVPLKYTVTNWLEPVCDRIYPYDCIPVCYDRSSIDRCMGKPCFVHNEHALSEYSTCSNTCTVVAGILHCMHCLAWVVSQRLSQKCHCNMHIKYSVAQNNFVAVIPSESLVTRQSYLVPLQLASVIELLEVVVCCLKLRWKYSGAGWPRHLIWN